MKKKGNNLNTEDIQNSNQEMNDLGTISEENKKVKMGIQMKL